MKTSLGLVSLIFIAHLASGVANAQVPLTISYQGILTDSEGQHVEDGYYEMHFRLYNNSDPQTTLWQETRNVYVLKGLFSVFLGTNNPLDLPFDQPYYLGMAVGEASELSPRMALTSSAYSLRARTIDPGQVVTSINGLRDDITLLAGNNIEMTQIDSTIVISAHINAGEGTITEITAAEGLMGGGTEGVINLTVADGGISAVKIAEGAVTSEKLGNASVLTQHLADSSVTTSKLASESVTQDKIHPDVSLPLGGSAGGDLTGNYPNPVISDNVITGNKIILPLILNGESSTAILSNEEVGIYGESSADEGSGIFGRSTANDSYNTGVKGVSNSGNGVYGLSESGVGLFGRTNSENGYAGIFQGRSTFEDRVGIGTYTPQGKLDLHHQSSLFDPHLFLTETSTDGFARIIMGNTTPDNRQWFLQARSTSTQTEPATFQIYERSGNTIHTRFTITESSTTLGGKNGEFVGIGLGNPSEMLHVSGAIRISNTNRTGPGTIRWTGSDFEGRFSDQWVSMTSNNAYIRVTPDSDPDRAPTIVAGHPSNWTDGEGSSGTIIAGGGLGTNPNTTSSAIYSTISGGAGNSIIHYSYSSIGGGFQNKNVGNYSTIGGGFNNITGNYDETEQTDASYSTIGGGRDNLARGLASTVPGGAFNSANGSYSLAAGRRAKAVNDGTFIWADATNTDFSSTGNNQFLIRAAGGVGINTNSPRSMLTLRGPDDATFGPNILLFGNTSDQFESGRIRFVEGTAPGNWRGAYLHFDGSANKFHIGVHNTNDNSTGNDVNAITITRASAPSVGIGTENPTSLLHVFGNVAGTGVLVERDGGALVKTISNLSEGSIGTSNNTAFRIVTNNAVRMHVPATGGVGIGTTNPGSFLLAVNGDAAKPGGGSWSVFSDQRLKHDIRQLEPGSLDRLLSIQGYTFEYLDKAIENRLALPGRQTGLIAQEVLEVFPDWVGTDDDGYLYITERGLTALLIEALRELRQEKDAHIRRLILQNQSLEERLEHEKKELATRLEHEKNELAIRLEHIEAALDIPSSSMKAKN